jgi:hypothetical protein
VELVQNSKDTLKYLCVEKRADMRIPGGLLFISGVVPSFRLAVSIVASQKIQFWYTKKWKTRFPWDETENGPCGVPHRSKGHTRV